VLAMGRMPMAERRHFAVFGVLRLHNVVAVVVAADVADVADAAGPFPVEIFGGEVMRRANGGSRCLRTEVWQ
jgi:hypothetical protein